MRQHPLEVRAPVRLPAALSERLGVPLLTADERLVRKLPSGRFSVQWLGAWSPPS